MTSSLDAFNTPKKGVLVETIFTYVLMAAFAVFTTIIGAVLLLLVEEFGLPLARGGDFIAAQNLGCFAGIILVGFLLDRYNKNPLVLVFYLVFSLALVMVFFTTTMRSYMFLLAIAGFSTKILDAVFNSRISELHPVNRGFYMNLLHSCYGMGSFIGPVYARGIVRWLENWRASYAILGCLGIILAAGYGVCFMSSKRRHSQSTLRRPATVASFRSLASRNTAVCCLVLLCYCGHQIGMNTWFPSYMSETLGTGPMAAGLGLSTFWLGLIAGRLACSVLTRKIPEKRLLFLGNLLGGGALLLCVAGGNEAAAFAGAAAAGFFAGATIPMVLTLAYTWHAAAQGKISMVMFIAITVGGTVGPMAMGGVVNEGGGLTRPMFLNGILLIAAAVIVLLLGPDDCWRRDWS